MKQGTRLPWIVAMMLSAALAARAQAPATSTAATVPVLMLSDIHFDPFHDPAKFTQLKSSPIASWAAILGGADSLNQPAQFAHLQRTCGARGSDTSIQLLQASLRAAQARESSPLFVTVSGDLLAHEFACRFHTLAPEATAAGFTAFAEKTVAFVALRLRQSFPASPVYFALGNNDSGCSDYREDAGSDFLRAAAQSFAADVLDPASHDAILREFPQEGDYSVVLPAPMSHARLIVLQDVFESRRYAACNGAASNAPAAAQMDWLRAQLTAARAAHERVWVMGHIPPGVDVYTTLAGAHDVCGGQPPGFFLRNSDLADVLAGFPGVIRLAIFAHTHMDEVRLLRSSSGAAVPAKLVPSLSPVDGNNPAFILAEVNPRTATMEDYSVYAASNQTGIGTAWRLEYRYATTYGLPDFSSASVGKLTAGLVADRNGTSAASRHYERFYFVGLPGQVLDAKAVLMQFVWPAYACSLNNMDGASYRACVCPAGKPAARP